MTRIPAGSVCVEPGLYSSECSHLLLNLEMGESAPLCFRCRRPVSCTLLRSDLPTPAPEGDGEPLDAA